MKAIAAKLPTFDRLMNPLLRSLRALGGSGSVEEIYDKVVEIENLPDDVLSQLHDPEKSNQTEVAYRLVGAHLLEEVRSLGKFDKRCLGPHSKGERNRAG